MENKEVAVQEGFDEIEDDPQPANEYLETQRQSQMGKDDLEKNDQLTRNTFV